MIFTSLWIALVPFPNADACVKYVLENDVPMVADMQCVFVDDGSYAPIRSPRPKPRPER